VPILLSFFANQSIRKTDLPPPSAIPPSPNIPRLDVGIVIEYGMQTGSVTGVIPSGIVLTIFAENACFAGSSM
jgi:hypothetical protein